MDILCTPDDQQQFGWHWQLIDLQHQISPAMGRQYFHSIYFREPGGVPFEIATDPPGFTVDEPLERLGTGLMLPAAYEKLRKQIEWTLPEIKAFVLA